MSEQETPEQDTPDEGAPDEGTPTPDDDGEQTQPDE